MDEHTMIDLAVSDLDAAHERLYVAAKRYVRAFERDEIDQEHHHDDSGPHRIHIGPAAGMLSDAMGRFEEAYGRAEATGAFDGEDIPDTYDARNLACLALASVDTSTEPPTFNGQPVTGYAEKMERMGEDHVYGCRDVGHGVGE